MALKAQVCGLGPVILRPVEAAEGSEAAAEANLGRPGVSITASGRWWEEQCQGKQQCHSRDLGKGEGPDRAACLRGGRRGEAWLRDSCTKSQSGPRCAVTTE